MARRKRRERRRRGGAWWAFLHVYVATDLDERGQVPELSPEEILAWADAYRARTGLWPNCRSGPIPEAPGETWLAVEAALSLGLRGLPGGSTLARFLAELRGRYNKQDPPLIPVKQILAWADAWHQRTGQWPIRSSGDIADTGGINWTIVDKALRHGRCGLLGGSSLARLLAAERGVRNNLDLPRLDIEKILAWADRHYEDTGAWPIAESGPISGAPEETWKGVEVALRQGGRGLPGGSSLARLGAEQRGLRNQKDLPPLGEEQILVWADAAQQRSGVWPNSQSGPILEAPGETWEVVDTALRQGYRGLRGGSSLAQFLDEHRGVRNRKDLPELTRAVILAWTDAFHARTGQWPTRRSGPILEAPGETWYTVHDALYIGLRGLPGGSSLARLLARERGVRNLQDLPPLTIEQILQWAEAHQRRTGSWPTSRSGSIADVPGQTWEGVHKALSLGRRSLPGGTTLSQLLRQHFQNALSRTSAP